MGYKLTYSQLVDEVQSIVDSTNDEFVSNLPKIIARAHDQVQRDLDLEIWRTFATPNITNSIIVREPNWLKVLSINIPSLGAFLGRRSLDYVRACGSTTGVPRYWADRSESEIMVAPAPDVPYVSEIEVMTRLESPSESLEETWILRNCADLMLLQTLIGSEVYLVGAERVAEFASLYKIVVASAIDELRGSGRREYEPVREASKPTLEKTT